LNYTQSKREIPLILGGVMSDSVKSVICGMDSEHPKPQVGGEECW